jgi:hypothetical protein
MNSRITVPAIETRLSRRSILLSAVSASVSTVPWPAFSADDNEPRLYSAADFLDSVGICVHVGNRQLPFYSHFEKGIEILKDIGIRHIRDAAVFASYVDRNHEFYQRIRKMVGVGFRFDLECSDPLNGYLFLPPRRLPDVYEWCDHGVEIFEGSNEPNLVKNSNMNAAISAEHQRTLYAVAKGTPALHDVIIASPSYIQKNVGLAENISDVVDWINIHPYPGMEHPETKGPGALSGFVTATERICGKKPVLASETGYHTAVQTTSGHLPVSEQIKTRYLPRLLLWYFINGVKKTYIYELIDSFNNGPADKESHFGLVSFDLTPKPSYAAVKQLLALCDRPTRAASAATTMQYRFTGDTRDLQTAALARGDGTHLLFAWLGVAGWDPGARQPRAPVARKVVLAVAPGVRSVVAHQFQDDGSIAKTSLENAGAGFQLMASDQLTALEISL